MAKATARRLAGDGSLYQRKDGLWVAALDEGYTANGTRKRWTGASRTKEGALAKLREARGELDATGTITPKGKSVAEWLDEWLETIARPRIRPKTYNEYERCVRLHLKPRIGRAKLVKLQPQHVRAMEVAIAKAHSPATANNVHRCLRTALSDAIAEGLLTRNVAAAVTPPTVKAKTREPLTAEDAITLLEQTKADPMGSRWAFALLTGTRQGEALGLEWDRVDLKAGTVDISWQLQRLSYSHGCGDKCGKKRGGNCPKRVLEVPEGFEVRSIDNTGLVLTRPKTDRSTRLIPLTPFLVDSLKKLRRSHIGPGLVWTKANGLPIDPQDDAEAWDQLLKDLNLPDTPLHAARHTTATLLMKQGVDAKVIQDIMGHTSVTVTRGYQHTDLAMARQAMNTLDDLLAK